MNIVHVVESKETVQNMWSTSH